MMIFFSFNKNFQQPFFLKLKPENTPLLKEMSKHMITLSQGVVLGPKTIPGKCEILFACMTG